MTALDAGGIAVREICRNWLRSSLTVLGIVIGVATFIVLVCLGRGATAEVESQVAGLGKNVLLVERASGSRGAVRLGQGTAAGLTFDDAAAITTDVPGVVAVSPEVYVGAQATAEGRNWSTKLYGEGPDYFDIRRWPMDEGEAFTENDLKGAQQVAVLGRTTARELFGDDSPVGESVRVNNVVFRIIGLLSSKGVSVRGSDDDDVILVPTSTDIGEIAQLANALY